MEGKIA